MAKKKQNKSKQLSVLDNKIYPSIDITEELENSYLDYAMSVIVSRALPDIRDGLKPVHRRILYSMYESGYHHNKPYKKSARIVGDVMGKYHPHGDSSIYEAMVRMAQDFTMRLPLIDGQGNYGSMDGDPAAAMRYTEARLAKVSSFMLEELEYETVATRPNYDETMHEPKVLPSKFPNIFVNGASGIAVGMATNIPPHNLGEIIDATLLLVDEPDTSSKKLHKIVKGPDFPTGGIISGNEGLLSMYETGRGSVSVISKLHDEKIKNRNAIVITEIPYLQNKSKLLERIAEVVNSKVIEGISDIRDESNKEGVRIVIELKNSAMEEVVKNQLFQYTPLKSSFSSNMLALNETKPITLNLHDGLSYFIDFRKDVITKRTVFKLNKAREKANLLIGLAIAVNSIDQVISLIKKSKNPLEAKEKLLDKKWPVKSNITQYIKLINPNTKVQANKIHLDENQAKAILELRLQKLTALEREDLLNSLKELTDDINAYLKILNSNKELLKILKEELIEVKTNFATPRKTEIQTKDFQDIDTEDLIIEEDVVITVSHQGYIKRVTKDSYKIQKRGGKGKKAMTTRDEDFLEQVFSATTRDTILFFTSTGKVYSLKTYELPPGTPQSRGKAIINLIPITKNEKISSILRLPKDIEEFDNYNLVFATSLGNIRKNKMKDVAMSGSRKLSRSGKTAIKLKIGDRLIGVISVIENDDVQLATTNGKSIRFASKDLREFTGLGSSGVRGIKLSKDDKVVSICSLIHNKISIDVRESYLKAKNEAKKDLSKINKKFQELAEKEEFLLCITENGYGKLSSAYEYRITNRGGSGVTNITITPKNGRVVKSLKVSAEDNIALISDNGKLLRCNVGDNIRVVGRVSQGVSVFKVDKKEKIVAVARLEDTDD
ncbi:MAG: DNA gyrase subunit A [Pelagibacteraceae bacterium]|nr:DNA gyrase subunit A [Pelagibacteraceae bacterium]